MTPLKAAFIAALVGLAGVASAQAQPGLTVSVGAPASVATGPDRTIATIALRAGGEDVTLEKLPLSMGYSDAQATPLSGCMLHRDSAAGAPLNTGANALGQMGSGDVVVTLDDPLEIPANSTAVLYLTCSIPATAPNGSAVATSIFVSQVEAEADGASATVEGSDPQKGATAKPLGIAVIQSATAGTPGTGGDPGGIPGIPNTGGGNSMVLWTLLSFIGLAGAGISYASLRRA